MSNSDYLNNLSKESGIDFNLIKKKYENINQGTSESSYSKLSNHNSIQDHRVGSDLDNHSLDKYRICKSCLGKGTIKTIYNHMVLEKECEECLGESIVFTQNINEKINHNVNT